MINDNFTAAKRTLSKKKFLQLAITLSKITNTYYLYFKLMLEVLFC